MTKAASSTLRSCLHVVMQTRVDRSKGYSCTAATTHARASGTLRDEVQHLYVDQLHSRHVRLHGGIAAATRLTQYSGSSGARHTWPQTTVSSIRVQDRSRGSSINSPVGTALGGLPWICTRQRREPAWLQCVRLTHRAHSTPRRLRKCSTHVGACLYMYARACSAQGSAH